MHPRDRQRCGQRQVHATDRHGARHGVQHDPPLGTERGERQEHGSFRSVDDVAEQRHRQPHAVVGGERQERIGLLRQFEEHDVGPQLVKGALDRAGGAGTVVPDAEEVNAHPVVSRDAM